MNEATFRNKIESCRELLDNQVKSTIDILERRLVFDKLREIIKSNDKLKKDNIFLEYYFKNYIDAQIMAIMRILDTDNSSKNLFRLLDSLISGFVIDDSFLVRIKNDVKVPEINSLNEAINASIPVLDIEEIRCDKYKLNSESENIKKYRDWKIAHRDTQKWEKLNLSMTEVNRCIDLIHEKVKYYHLAIDGGGYTDLTPSIQYDWEEIFRIPWIKRINNNENFR